MVPRRTYLEQNLQALDVTITQTDRAAIEAAFPRGSTAGPRYAEAAMKAVNR